MTARRQRAARVVWAVLFVGAVAAVPWLNRQTAGTSATATAATGSAQRYGFRLTEAARAAGIDFTHTGPTFDARLNHIMPQVAAMGAAVAVADFDRDGWQDFYVTNSGEGSPNRLYRNTGQGQFEDVAAAMGVADVNHVETGVSMGAVWGDYDNDGFEDLLVYKYGRPELFHNVEGRRFERVTERAGLPAWVNANSATWLDYDRDGRLDLFIAGYWADDVNLWRLDHHPHHAGELRIRRQRRAEVFAPQQGRRLVRGRDRGARHHQPAVDAGGGGGGSARHGLPGSRSSPTTTASPSSTRTRAASGSWTWPRRPAWAARRRAG